MEGEMKERRNEGEDKRKGERTEIRTGQRKEGS